MCFVNIRVLTTDQTSQNSVGYDLHVPKLETRNLAIPRTLAVFFLLLLSVTAVADRLRGEVVGITDGDTVTLMVNREQYKIRLAEIDTPERGQPWCLADSHAV